MTDRSPNATKEEMQEAIDILRARGDSAVECLYALRDVMHKNLKALDAHLAKMEEVDRALKISKDDRKNNAVITARRMLGTRGVGKTDEEVLKMVGAHNE